MSRQSSNQFAYYVFVSAEAEPTAHERASGVYLRAQADGQFLSHFFVPMYEHHQIGIDMTDDEVVSGEPLEHLANIVAHAISVVRNQPESWLVCVGYEFLNGRNPYGPPEFEPTSRAKLLTFLEGVEVRIEHARARSACVHFGGGL